MDYTTVPMVIFWGILGTIYVFFVQSHLLKIITSIPEKYKHVIAYAFIILYLIDLAFSINNVFSNPEVLYKLVNI